MQAIRGLGRITFGRGLMTNGISFVLIRPFRKIENASKDKNEEKREAMVVQTKLFDQRAGDAFTDMDCKITDGFHTSQSCKEDHLTLEVRDSKGQPTYWYKKSESGYYDVVHVHKDEALIKPNDYVRISEEMFDVGRLYRKEAAKADTYWHNANAKHLVEWKANEAVIPPHLLVDYAAWTTIDHAKFIAEKAHGATVLY